MFSLLTVNVPDDSIFSEARKHGWSDQTTEMMIEKYLSEFWKSPGSFSDLLEVLE